MCPPGGRFPNRKADPAASSEWLQGCRTVLLGGVHLLDVFVQIKVVDVAVDQYPEWPGDANIHDCQSCDHDYYFFTLCVFQDAPLFQVWILMKVGEEINNHVFVVNHSCCAFKEVVEAV